MRSANILKLSMNMLVGGQEACILSLMGACAVAGVGCRNSARNMPAITAASSSAMWTTNRFLMTILPCAWGCSQRQPLGDDLAHDLR